MSDQLNTCDKENTIHQLLKVQAQVKDKPLVKHGIPKVYCVHSCIKPHFNCCNEESNNFTITQLIRVEIPISFGADVDIKKGIICCGNPDMSSDCKHDFKDDIKRNPIYILMNNKIMF